MVIILTMSSTKCVALSTIKEGFGELVILSTMGQIRARFGASLVVGVAHMSSRAPNMGKRRSIWPMGYLQLPGAAWDHPRAPEGCPKGPPKPSWSLSGPFLGLSQGPPNALPRSRDNLLLALC